MKHFTTISEFFRYLHITAPNHPMFAVVDLTTEGGKWRITSPPITTDFFAVAIKRVLSGTAHYGRSIFDFQAGVMVFTQPGQVMQWSEMELVESGYFLVIHKNFICNTYLEGKLKNYGFFSYAVSEALHLSEKEEQSMLTIYQKLNDEYKNVYDPYNKDILLSFVNTILSYSQRYYNRQFENRRPLNVQLVEAFQQKLGSFRAQKEGAIPTVAGIASRMNMSPKYLSDVLKTTTGKTALEHIHLSLIDEAKDKLIQSQASVAEIAYNLGFEYPQYFTRLFKNKLGISPTMYSRQHKGVENN